MPSPLLSLLLLFLSSPSLFVAAVTPQLHRSGDGPSGGRRVGGWSVSDTSSAAVVAAAQRAVWEWTMNNSTSLRLHKLAPHGVVAARQQVVSGMKYCLDLDAVLTSCARNGDAAASADALHAEGACDAVHGAEPYRLRDVAVWTQAWRGFFRVSFDSESCRASP